MSSDSTTQPPAEIDRRFMRRAAMAAFRAIGLVEPNPMVGAVIVRDGKVLAIGHHRRFGGLHAEREALADCRARGIDPRGSTVYVTLEPCNGHGKQPPCVEALREAGLARVVYAAADPNPGKAGGAAALRADGFIVEQLTGEIDPIVGRLTAPFIKRLSTGLPWVTAKWAQTIDGRIATRTGESKWISGPVARRRVHRLRARVDAIITGVGTVLADDPMLTARDVRAVRRVARRVVIDSDLRTPIDSALVRTARQFPTTIICRSEPRDAHRHPRSDARHAFLDAGVDLIEAPADAITAGVDLQAALRTLAARHGVWWAMIESGPRLLGSLLRRSLIDEAVVHLAPMILADENSRPAASGVQAPSLADASRWVLRRAKTVGAPPAGTDLELWYARV